jgi:hypothetical protein
MTATGSISPHGVPPPDADEQGHLAAVRRYQMLDTSPDDAFDQVASLAARIFHAPMAGVAIVDTDRVWFKATHGLGGVTQVGRDPGLCASAILHDTPYVVTDALADPRTATTRSSEVSRACGSTPPRRSSPPAVNGWER